jgi:hypothetical protein
VKRLRIIFDSNLNRKEENNLYHYRQLIKPLGVPETMTRKYRVDVLSPDEEWITLVKEDNNYLRLRRHTVDISTRAVRLIVEGTWGADKCHIFAWEIE